jgi:hypothetical protein
LQNKVKKGRERRKEGNSPCAVRAERGKENPPTSISLSPPKMEKGV